MSIFSGVLSISFRSVIARGLLILGSFLLPGTSFALPPSMSAPSADYDGTFTVSWSINAPSGQGYSRLNQRINGGSWMVVADRGVGSYTHTVTASSSATYYFYVSYGYLPQPCGMGCGLITGSTSTQTTVVTINTAPTISDIGNQTINEDANTGSLGFTIGDAETAAGSLTVSATSSNTTLIPNANLTFGGSGANRTITATPAANQNGATTITVSVSDGTQTASDTFVLTVNPVNDAPTISNISNQTINEDSNTGALSFTIGDDQTAAGSLTVTASSSNTTLVPNANLSLGGTDAGRTLAVTPAANQTGSSTITVTVSDGTLSASDTFTLTVNAVNDAPTISSIGNVSINEGASTGAIAFTVGDLETAAGSLTVTASSSNTAVIPSVSLGGSGASRTVSVTAKNDNGVGSSTITVTVSDGSLAASEPFTVTVNDIPATFTMTTSTDSDGDGAYTLSWIAGDDNVRLSENGSVIIEMISPSVSGYPITRTQNGTYNYTLEDCYYSGPTRNCNVSDTASMVVSGITHPPTISNIGNQTINEDASTGAIGFTVGDGNIETSPGSLTVSATSNNTSLIPNSNLTIGGSGANRTITVSPATNLSGSATITVTVSDGALTASDTFVVTVNAVNDTPTISNISNQTINEDTNTGSLGFTIGDVETAAGSLTVTASSNNQTLVPNANLSLSGTGASRTITATPAANQNGSATITVTVSDGANSASDTFTLTVNAVNDAPTISNISNQTINEDGTTGSIPFTVGDDATAAGSLTVTASSSNTTLIPNANLSLGGSGASRTITVTPAATLSGSATITVTVSDGALTASDTFLVTINVVNDTPTISNIANQTINEDGNTGSLGFTVGDEETTAGSLTVTASSSNTTLVPNNSSNLTFGGLGASRTITVTPAANQYGLATITVTVSDGVNSAVDTFVVTVTAINDIPTISDINDQTIDEDSNTGALNFTVGDVETAAGSLTVTATSSNQTLVPDTNLALTNSGASRTITATPAANKSGSATITVTVSDGTASVSDTFTLTVSSVNDAPTITNIFDQTINEDNDTGLLFFNIGDAETAAASLTVTVWSSNSAVVPNTSVNLALSGSGVNRSITVKPGANKFGSSTITVTVSDGTLNTSDTFIVTVNPVSDAPVISNIPDQTINQDNHTDSLAFTVSDAETVPGSLTVTASSSNTVLVPNENDNLSLAGSAGSRAITVTPDPSQSGTVTITVTVSDGSLSTSETFDVAVNMVPQSPSDSDGDGNFTVSWTVDPGPNQGGYAQLKQRFNGGGWTFVTQKDLGSQSHPISVSQSGTYEYKVDYAYMPQDPGCGPGCNPQLIPGTMTLPTVVVLMTPGLPSIGSASADGCAGSIGVSWSVGTGYPAGSTIYFDLQESIDGGISWIPRLSNTTLNSWSRNAAASDSYQYRVRSRYTLGGYYSNYTSWVSNSALVMPGCTGGGSSSSSGGGGETIPQPPELPSDLVGSVEGSFNVAPSGAAGYSVPLEVPPGIGGMAPKLSLEYNSQGGAGFVGTGWSLGGISAITRCAATQEPDGIIDGVDFDQYDRFCLDGKKLIKVPGTGSNPDIYGSEGSEYRTEFESFSKIIAVGSAGGEPASFIVHARTGEEMLYGYRADSRIEAQGRSDVMTWALDTITDSTNNKMEFYYTEIAANSEYVPLRVEYAFAGGVSGARVQFGYSTQGSSDMYVRGSVVRNTQLLQTVTTYVGTSQEVKRYELDYDVAPATKRPRLTSLTECSLVSGTVCLPPTVFSWYGGQTPLGLTHVGEILSTHSIGWGGKGQWAIDVNADGIQEMIYNQHDTPNYWYVKKMGSSWNTQLWATFEHSVAKVHHYWPMDVNGDGLTDLVYMSDDDYYVVVNHGNGNTSEQHWGSRSYPARFDGMAWPMDVNSDGRMDLVYNKQDPAMAGPGGIGQEHPKYYALIAGDNFDATEVYLGERSYHEVGLNGAHWVTDINSDGRSDLVYIEAGTKNYWAIENNGAGAWAPEFLATRTYDAAYDYVNWAMDANADGLLDFVYSQAGTSNYRVLINKGDGSMTEEYFGEREETPGLDGAHWVIDVNADGVSDLVYNDDNNADDYYAIVSRPDGNRVHELWGSNIFMVGNNGRHMEMDANGDGFTDLLTQVYDSKEYSAIGMQVYSFDVLKTVTDGLGNVTSIEYKVSTNNTVYTQIENPYNQYPSAPAAVPLRVVSKVTVPDGVGGTRSTIYSYKTHRMNRTGRGSLGFAEVVSSDFQSNIRVETKHIQTPFPLTGLVSESTRCLITSGVCAPGNTLQKTVNTYEYCDESVETCPQPVKAKFVYPSQTVETMYGLNNQTNTTTPMAVITTKNENPDNYGNMRLITVKTDSLVNADFYETKTENIYDNDEANWRLGLLTSTTVTKYLNGGTLTDGNSVRRTDFEYFEGTNLLRKEIVEPDRAEPFKRVTVYARDSYGNITQATSCATDFESCAPGAPGPTGPNDLPFRTVTTVYDAFGQFLQSVTNAENESENYVYDRKFGNTLSLTGPNLLTTSWTYDGFGKVLKETRADGTRTVTTYKWCDGDCPQHGRYYVRTQSTGAAPVTEYFDAQGRKLRTRSVGFDGRNIHTDTVYNNRGQPAHVSEPYFEDSPVYWTQSEYDLIGRIISMTPPLSPAVQTDYDLLTVTMSRIVNGEFRTESETKNIIGQVVNVTNPAGTELIYTYDSHGNLKTTVTQGHANTVISVNYDLLGRKTQMIDPDMGTWNYQYNGYGELVSQTNGLNQTVTMKYDKLGRLIERNEPEGQSLWVYGASASAHNIGKLVSISGPNGLSTKTYTYDDQGRPSETTTIVNIAPYISESYATGQTYDTAGRVSTVLYPEVETSPGVESRFQVKNHYNPLGYLSKVSSLDGSVLYWEAQELNARGQLELVLLGNNASVLNTYVPETGWLDGTMVDANDLIYHMTYEIDEVGNIESRTDQRQGLTEAFEYDILDQLTYSNVTGGTASYTAKNYQYDALGNITLKSDVGGDGVYNYGTCGAGPHAVCQAGGSNYFYNANGSMTSGGGRTVSYYSFNLPYQFVQGGTTVNFRYGADRTRVFKSDGSKNTAYIGMTGTGNPLYEHEVQGTTNKHLHFIYAEGQALAVHTIQTGSSPQTKTEYLHRDHLGSVEAMSNSSGVAVAYFSHDPWGKARNPDWTDATGTPSGAPGNLGFTGHEMIPEVGLIHMNGRVYDPLLGKFLSADPSVQFSKDVRTYNRYSYVTNNPLRYTDPTGYSLSRLMKWVGKHFQTILNVISWFYPPLRVFVMAMNMMTIALAASSPGQALAGMLAAYIGGNLSIPTSDSIGGMFLQVIVKGAIGAVTGGVNAMIMGTDIRRGIREGMRGAAATAAVKWALTGSPADNVGKDTKGKNQDDNIAVKAQSNTNGSTQSPDAQLLADRQAAETDIANKLGINGKYTVVSKPQSAIANQTNSSGAHGTVVDLKDGTYEIWIDRAYRLSSDDYWTTLYHEMRHVWQFKTGIAATLFKADPTNKNTFASNTVEYDAWTYTDYVSKNYNVGLDTQWINESLVSYGDKYLTKPFPGYPTAIYIACCK